MLHLLFDSAPDRNNHLILEIRAKNVNFVKLSGIPN